MKKIITICAAILMTASVFAQAPQKMSYQAVIRNSNDQLVANQTVGMQISILQGSASGTIVYSEIQTPTTNINGLVSLEIGTGTTSDDFSSIDWANGPYFIETKTAVVPPLTTYTITGTSQLLSVPYALHAKTADNGITTAQADAIVANTLKVGITQAQADAIVANTAKVGITNEQADAIVANTAKVGITTEQADAIVANTAKVGISTEQATKLAGIEAEAQKNVQADWNATSGDAQILNKPTIPAAADGSETKVTAGTNVTVTGSGTTASPYVINASNGGGGGTRYLGEEYLGGIIFYLYTDATGTQKGLVVSKTETTTQWQSATSTTGATRTEDGEYNTANMINSPAKNWVENLGVDWYLPSVDELSFLWQNRFHVNKTSRAIGSTLLNIVPYWSSTEGSASDVYVFDFYSGYPYYSDKTWDFKVRAVRSF